MITTPDVFHLPPRIVPLKEVENDLSDLRKEGVPADAPLSALLRACTLTLVVLCDRNEDPADLEALVEQIVVSHPARVILIAPHDPDAESWLETRISTYTVSGGTLRRLVGEEIALYSRGAQYDLLPSAVLALRVSGLPFVLYWRGQPDLEDPLFRVLVGDCDQILFDSQHFTARAERINNTIAALRLDYPDVSFGDVNWQRIRPWRELVAQFFDDPANIDYLETITRVVIEFSVGFNGNQSAAVLMMAWLASSLGWRVVYGSYHREGLVRRARFERARYGSRDKREIEFIINVREQDDCMPGELTGVRIETSDDLPESVFQALRAVGGLVDVRELTLNRFSERCLFLNVPHESTVITAELDAPRRDRNYHRALELLDSLLGSAAP
jgi:glucose-6-phosphate dehydrogenase assembly protein OpcA